MTRPPIGTLVVVALLAVGTLAVGGRSARPAPVAAVSQVPVVGATAVCPDLRQRPGVLSSRVSVGVAPVPAGVVAGPGAVSARRVSGKGPALAVPVTRPGQVGTQLGTMLDSDGLVVQATGSLAAGLEVEQIDRGETGADRGLAGVRCEPPQTEAWFEGGSTQLGNSTVLVLSDVDATPSLVDVTVWSASGPVDPRPGQGIEVAPHGRVLLNLDRLAPDRSLLAVHVVAHRGRVASALRHSTLVKGIPQGIDWVPQGTPPATTVVVPGVPEGPGRSLLVTNPGSDPTAVRVQVTTADGQFVPTGLESVAVPAGTSVSLPLDPLTATSALGVTLISEGGPVLAGLLAVDRQQGEASDLSYTAGALPLSGAALVTDLIIDQPVESTLILTAPGEAASVVVTPLQVLGAGGAPPAPRTVAIAAGRTASLKLSTFFPAGTRAQLAVEVRPEAGSGPVYAVRYLRERGVHGPLSTLLVLRGPANLVDRPAVVRDPAAAIGGS